MINPVKFGLRTAHSKYYVSNSPLLCGEISDNNIITILKSDFIQIF
jgi:hypothetical protein